MSEISDILKLFLDELAKDLKKNIPVSSGKTAESVEVKVRQTGGAFSNVSGVILAAPYIQVLEDGRKPGKMPPVASIKKWVETQSFKFPLQPKTTFGSVIKNADGLSWAIAIKISQEGSKLFRDGGKSGVISNVITDNRIDAFTKAFTEKSSRIILDNILKRTE